MVQEGMPRFGRGLYPLKACVQWYVGTWRDRALAREGDTEKKRKQSLENTMLEARVKEATGHLIDRKEVLMVWSSTFTRLGRALDALPKTLQRELAWSPDTARIVKLRVDEARKNFVRDSAEYIDVQDEPGEKHAAAKPRS